MRARCHDPDFQCDRSRCYYDGEPDKVATITTYVDLYGTEQTFCDACAYFAVAPLYGCAWCGRTYAAYDDGTRYTTDRMDEYLRQQGLSLLDLMRTYYGGTVEGLGLVCWPCLVSLGPRGASPLRALPEEELRARFGFDREDPMYSGEAVSFSAFLEYRRAFRDYRVRVCDRVCRDDQARAGNSARQK